MHVRLHVQAAVVEDNDLAAESGAAIRFWSPGLECVVQCYEQSRARWEPLKS